jgi:hypothetical protein
MQAKTGRERRDRCSAGLTHDSGISVRLGYRPAGVPPRRSTACGPSRRRPHNRVPRCQGVILPADVEASAHLLARHQSW